MIGLDEISVKCPDCHSMVRPSAERKTYWYGIGEIASTYVSLRCPVCDWETAKCNTVDDAMTYWSTERCRRKYGIGGSR